VLSPSCGYLNAHTSKYAQQDGGSVMDTGRLKVKGMLDASANDSALILPKGGLLDRPLAPTGGMMRYKWSGLD
jgi:hypothetical protein